MERSHCALRPAERESRHPARERGLAGPFVPGRYHGDLRCAQWRTTHRIARDHSSRREGTAVNASHARGFTLVELLVALTLFALLATVLSGALRLVGRSWEGGEAKVAQLDEMRQAQTLLRSQIASLFPQRMPKAV